MAIPAASVFELTSKISIAVSFFCEMKHLLIASVYRYILRRIN